MSKIRRQNTSRPARLIAGLAAAALAGAFLWSPADGSHQVSACGRLLEFVAPPGADAAAGLGRMRLATASGELTFLFHHDNASKLPSTTEPGATLLWATVCFSGTHVVSASPVRADYISPYDLRVVPPGSLPTTSTATGSAPRWPLIALALATAGALTLLHVPTPNPRARRSRGDESGGPRAGVAGPDAA